MSWCYSEEEEAMLKYSEDGVRLAAEQGRPRRRFGMVGGGRSGTVSRTPIMEAVKGFPRIMRVEVVEGCVLLKGGCVRKWKWGVGRGRMEREDGDGIVVGVDGHVEGGEEGLGAEGHVAGDGVVGEGGVE